MDEESNNINCNNNIQMLSAAEFKELHASHLLSHPPDNVLFPFLHGLEGNNAAQNHFFLGNDGRAKVPDYRGLMLVGDDDDEDRLFDEDEDWEFEEEEEEEEDDTSSDSIEDPSLNSSNAMDVDVSIVGGDPDTQMKDIVSVEMQDEEKHMHPVQHRAVPPPSPPPPLDTTPKPKHRHSKSCSSTSPLPPPRLTSTFRVKDLIQQADGEDEWEFVPLRVPDGISLRNFGIQVPILCTISDIVVYSPTGTSPNAISVATKFRKAIDRKYKQRNGESPKYKVYVLDATPDEIRNTLGHLVVPEVNFPEREREEMRVLTKASQILTMPDNGGQVWLGNSGDVPLPDTPSSDSTSSASSSTEGLPPTHPLNPSPTNPGGYDICVECHDLAPFPTMAHLRAAEDKIELLEAMWRQQGSNGPRPAPHANSIIHLPFPSSPPNTTATLSALLQTIRFLERCISVEVTQQCQSETGQTTRRWSLFSPGPVTGPHRHRSFTSPSSAPTPATAATTKTPWSRPLKILLYSTDGYTESSLPALSLIMSVKGITLPEAYLWLQVEKRRSFFVYQVEVPVLRGVEERLRGPGPASVRRVEIGGNGKGGRPMAKSISFASPPPVLLPEHSASLPPLSSSVPSGSPPFAGAGVVVGRPRANTVTLGTPKMSPRDHQAWFDDPRFDGSFPSRVLEFLYLGNLNHASNAYMLHALGITHVVSVGECALVPPPMHCSTGQHHHQHQLWHEHNAGRIKVLDIQNVCDDGIDTLEPQLGPICEWIDAARQEGGNVLVHCRVGVSRSATVVIAYVMSHLRISLVEAYLIVRSRRLSVLIQPNMRLLYNLCGWEIRLARERTKSMEDEDEKLKWELSSSLSWPYLCREVHRLNEKYLCH